MSSASFQLDVTPADVMAFAALSGDWNPLHTDPEHAARTAYRRPVLHGAFAAGVVSRMAGMHLPGRDCLLHSMRLRFVAPIVPPVSLVVSGRQVSARGGVGRVDVDISDAASGTRYVDAVYEFGRHHVAGSADAEASMKEPARDAAGPAPILVTGATGGLGQAVLARLAGRACGVTRTVHPGMVAAASLEQLASVVPGPIGGIVHCAWPAPDNERLTSLADIQSAFEHNVAAPLRQVIALAQLLAKRGTDNAMLVLVGSTSSSPGRHNYRMPLYSLSKALVPELARVLATELASSNKRCAAVTYDVIDGGMNKDLSPSARVAHTDRVPSGALPSLDEAAAQIEWVLENSSSLLSGATIALTGAAAP